MRRLPFLVFIFLFQNLDGQSISKELLFAQHLLVKKNYKEATYVLGLLKHQPAITSIQRDSIHYFLGNIYYNQKNLAYSITHFDSVSALSVRMRTEAIFFSAFSHAYLKKLNRAEQQMIHYTPLDSVEQHLRLLELSGIYLLHRNLKKFDSLQRLITKTNFITSQQEKDLHTQYIKITEQPKKSPWVAVALSTLIPGAGKFYAGQKGQGVYTFLISVVLGMQAWEGYHKDGPSSVRFIAYSSLFASLYIGTIWGSAFSVKVRRYQLNETINDQILFDMHIPLRTVFH
ncbi:MAG: hypothetical protein JST69_04600 [Bacteroidetes bacterium]|nr:hypothetical protein [Bacteroidota bacterium]